MSDFRWSFSQWETYNACPAKWKFKSVLKLPGLPPGPAAARGLKIHESVEKYIMGEHGVEGLDPAVKPKYLPIIDSFKFASAKGVELRVSLTENWRPAEGVNPWVVMVLDATARHRLGRVDVGEWKSGKPKETHKDQRTLYALGALAQFTEIEEAGVATHYLEDTAPSESLTVKRSAQDELKNLWHGRVEQMQADQYCAPKPGMQCNWCDYAKKKGGPCVFGS